MASRPLGQVVIRALPASDDPFKASGGRGGKSVTGKRRREEEPVQLHTLPEAVLLEILGYVGRSDHVVPLFTGVSKLWRSLGEAQPALWTQVTEAYVWRLSIVCDQRMVALLTKMGGGVRRLLIRNDLHEALSGPHETAGWVERLCDCCPHLESLTLSGAMLDQQTCSRVAESCPHLTELDAWASAMTAPLPADLVERLTSVALSPDQLEMNSDTGLVPRLKALTIRMEPPRRREDFSWIEFRLSCGRIFNGQLSLEKLRMVGVPMGVNTVVHSDSQALRTNQI